MPDREAAPGQTPHRGGPLARRLWGLAGLIAFGLGAAGAVLPVLPTTPFILLAAFCFARSSERLDTWFRGTRLYDLVFSNYMERRPMSVAEKLRLIGSVTLLLGIGFYFAGSLPVLRVIIAAVWVGHIVHFGFRVETKRP